MSDYYDNKGIRRYSKEAAESANEGYLREERRAREKAAEFQQQQVELQEEQVRLAERQRLEQMMHNARVEAQMEQQAHEEAIHREYTRDIQWLERSDPKGKFEFLSAKVQSELIDELARRVFDAFASPDSANAKEKVVFDSAFREFAAANAEAEKANSALKAVEDELQKANKMITESKPAAIGFGCLPIAVLFVIGAAYIAVQQGDLKEEERLGFTIFLGFFFVLPVIVLTVHNVFKKIRGKAQKVQLESTMPPIRRTAQKADKLRKAAFSKAKPLFTAWVNSSEQTIEVLVKHSFESGEAQKVLCDWIAAKQTQYPPLCRVDFSAVSPEVIRATVLPLQEAIYDSALSLQVAYVSEFAKALDESKEFESR